MNDRDKHLLQIIADPVSTWSKNLKADRRAVRAALDELGRLEAVNAELVTALSVFANRDNWGEVRMVGQMPSKPWEFAAKPLVAAGFLAQPPAEGKA
jgi:hypothetical protein